MPHQQEIRQKGYLAYFARIKLEENPYEDTSPESKEWARGWRDAEFDDKDAGVYDE